MTKKSIDIQRRKQWKRKYAQCVLEAVLLMRVFTEEPQIPGQMLGGQNNAVPAMEGVI